MTIKEFEKATGIRLNKSMSGKMEGIQCLSTSCLLNPFCAARRKNPNSICAKCYADSTCKRYAALRANMERNTEILCTVLFAVDELPIVAGPIFRFEAFGDLSNVTQARNYLRLCKRNPEVRFALWTKNPGILARGIAEEGKPDNLVVLLSSAIVNKRCDASRWWFVDKTFTVYDKDTIDRDGIDINCGARRCLSCQKCYRRDGESDIRELLK